MPALPKVIHYCWFGGSEMPEEYLRYMESWKRFCPDYEIRRWDESNFDIASSCAYVREAYEAKKWAFVSDYARIKILYENGGVYLDTDVELIRPLDPIVQEGDFLGIEFFGMKRGLRDDSRIGVNLGLGAGASAGNEIYREILEHYKTLSFRLPDGSLDQTTIVERVTAILDRYGFQHENRLQKIGQITVYPSEYFGPIDCATGEFRPTENTVSVHHYAASWADGSLAFKKKIKKLLGHRVTGFVISIKRLFKKSGE